jgi:hypothetical protein
MSPEEATALSTEGAAKLEGVKLHHFGAFFNREGRERDYLWGRLDTAERLIDLLLGDLTSHVTTAAKAILTEEEPNPRPHRRLHQQPPNATRNDTDPEPAVTSSPG